MSGRRDKLGSVVTLKRGYDLPEQNRVDGVVPVVSSAGVTGTHNESKVAGPGVVTGRYGTLGQVFYVPEDFWPLNTALYVRDFHGNDRRFVAYFLESVLRSTQSDKAAVPGVNRNDLHEMTVTVPEKPAQGRIAALLARYDDLIENNTRRMKLLKDAARLLYNEWFVRLRFPGHEHIRSTHGVPAGWCKVPLGDITTKIGSGFTPRGGEASYVSEGTPLIRSQNVYDDEFHEVGLAFVSEQHAADLAGVSVESKDILLNITGASVGRCCMAPDRWLPARVNQHVMIIRVDLQSANPFHVHQAINSDERKRQLLSYAQKGSTREALTKEMIANFEVTLPSEPLAREFGGIAESCFRQREVLAHQNQKLRTVRDLLLPRLMSGEVAV